MNDPRHRFAQQFPTPQRTEVLPAQAWQPVAPPHGNWQPAQSWPHQPQQQWQQQQWQQQQYVPLAQGWPQPAANLGQPSAEEKNAALGAYLGALFMPVLLPLLIMLTATNKPFQRAAGLQALIVQLSSLALYLCLPVLMLLLHSREFGFMFIYVPVLMIGVFSLGFGVLGMSAAQQGKIQYAPVIGRRLAKVFRAEWHR